MADRSHAANRRAAARIDAAMAGMPPLTPDETAAVLAAFAATGVVEDLGGGNYRLTEAGLRQAEALIDRINAVDN